MDNTTHNILSLNIASLLNGDHQYSIPVYQRNYAWGEAEITQLIQDIIDYIPKNEPAKDYHIGSLVVNKRPTDHNIYYETIDGQQRLTTLTLLACVIQHEYKSIQLPWFNKINLAFANRKSSTGTLSRIYKGDFSANSQDGIMNGYNLCKKTLKIKIAENGISIEQFTRYLFGHVKILQVTVPEDTDMNHYFEIMNSRGEQLEKHEILKAIFLDILSAVADTGASLEMEAFNLIWEACANMERYLQFGFTVAQRHAIFGYNDWNQLLPADFAEFTQKVKDTLNSKASLQKMPLSEIITGRAIEHLVPADEDVPDRFNTVINFPNFLLHVLSIYTRGNIGIPLDDKRLITTFKKVIEAAPDKVHFAREFSYALLKCKFFFDKYIIKREFINGSDKWSLARLEWRDGNSVSYINTFGDTDNGENRSILMLLSMFHVSAPTLVYKHWLNAALLYAFKHDGNIGVVKYKNYLLAIARSFVFDRFLSSDTPKEYHEIIYRSSGIIRRSKEQVKKDKLSFNNIQNNLIFNYLDYLLWEKHKDKQLVKSFEFSFRSSVEHYYPRTPMKGYPAIDPEYLDAFGNLCLISHSENSRLSNQPPIAKKSFYQNQIPGSIKQWVMMTKCNPDRWNEKAIADHEQEMLELMTSDMHSEFES